MSPTLISRTPRNDIIVRLFVGIIGGIAIWWGISGFSVFWQQSSVERVAGRIIAGDPFGTTILAQQLRTIESTERAAWCRPSALHGAAVIQLRMLEVAASTNDHKPAHGEFKSLTDGIRSSLSCSPADPFLWLVLYWAENARNGPRPEYFKDLRLSYQLGPNEGWIGVKRNGIAVANFDELPSDLATNAIMEFSNLVRNRFYTEAISVLVNVDGKIRDRLLQSLGSIDRDQRAAFAKKIYDKGYDFLVPGIVSPEEHPKR